MCYSFSDFVLDVARMFFIKRAVLVGGIIVPQCTSLSVSNFSSSNCLSTPKRPSPYSTVDNERYSSLVKSVMSSRVSSQTPESLQVEDEHIYGPVVKAQTPSSGPKMKAPKILHPFSNSEDILEIEDADLGPPARVILNRGKGRSSVPSVTRILQQTLSPDQIFYLERWKKRMIAELGEEGFKAYSQSKLFNISVSCYWDVCCYLRIIWVL